MGLAQLLSANCEDAQQSGAKRLGGQGGAACPPNLFRVGKFKFNPSRQISNFFRVGKFYKLSGHEYNVTIHSNHIELSFAFDKIYINNYCIFINREQINQHPLQCVESRNKRYS